MSVDPTLYGIVLGFAVIGVLASVIVLVRVVRELIDEFREAL